jgi:hypothetical protein
MEGSGKRASSLRDALEVARKPEPNGLSKSRLGKLELLELPRHWYFSFQEAELL